MGFKVYTDVPFETLKGLTLTHISGVENGSQAIFFNSEERSFRLIHYQDCCEESTLEDFEGDVEDLIGHPILMAELVSNTDDENKLIEWHFYKLATVKGSMTLRWMEDTDSYYSTEVSFEEAVER